MHILSPFGSSLESDVSTDDPTNRCCPPVRCVPENEETVPDERDKQIGLFFASPIRSTNSSIGYHRRHWFTD